MYLFDLKNINFKGEKRNILLSNRSDHQKLDFKNKRLISIFHNGGQADPGIIWDTKHAQHHKLRNRK